MIAKLRPGISLEAAGKALEEHVVRMSEAHPRDYPAELVRLFAYVASAIFIALGLLFVTVVAFALATGAHSPWLRP